MTYLPLKLHEIFSVEEVLKSKGYEVAKTSVLDNLLFPNEELNSGIKELTYNVFAKSKLRNELKRVLALKQEPQSQEVKSLTDHQDFIKGRERFDNTFEWFAGELMLRSFSAFSYAIGVEIKNIQRNTTGTAAGDFDALVVLRDTNMAYFECKAGDFDGQAILKCYERMLALNCKFSIFFCNDRIKQDDLIYKAQKIELPLIALHHLHKFSVKGKESDIVYEVNNCFILDTSGSIESKLRAILRINAVRSISLNSQIGMSTDSYSSVGYNCQVLATTRYN